MSLKVALGKLLAKAGLSPAPDAPLKPRTARQALGKMGEDHALALLKKRGHKLIARNVLFKRGELDLVTWHGKTLVFTEVRLRSSTAFGTPSESVGAHKQASVRLAADAFLARSFKPGQLPDCRFDMVCLVARDGKIVEAEVLEGAF